MDVIIAGEGLVGLAVALSAAARGLSVRLMGRALEGAASGAAAGLLAPSLGQVSPSVKAFMVAARDGYRDFVESLRGNGRDPLSVNRRGIIELAEHAADLESLTRAAPADALVLDAEQLARREPALAGWPGALLHPHDGSVDNLLLLHTMRTAVESEGRISRATALATRVDVGENRVSVRADDDTTHTGGVLVVAAGAWCSQIEGLPRVLPVVPVRGQMLALDAAPMQHVIAAPGCYTVPRGSCTLVGSTMEYAGFDAVTTAEAITQLHAAAASVSESLGTARRVSWWAGLRPVTPDMLPILGRDPDSARVLYACGHSKNGVLLAPITGNCIAALAAGDESPFDLSEFSPARFGPQ